MDALQHACDAHIHVFDPRFSETLAADDMSSVAAAADDYRRVQPHFGTSRVVIVTPRNYDVDNAVTVDAIRQLGQERARGIATVRPDITDRQLEALHAGGIRGLRFTLYTPDHAPTRFDMIEPLAQRIRGLGWHLQLHWTAAQIVEHRALVERLPVQFVFDHFARLPLPDALTHPACALVTGWLREGRAWLKLSAPYLDSRSGAASGYADMNALARHWIDVAPDRLVWGSDWPHTSKQPPPSPRSIAATQRAWFASPAIRQQILVDNPAALYGF
ncbi:amidohydrolase family protein [Paraburkholderia sp.]|uniref:amidohydrolase family protein n=1 Tax=Paraburkholderia sp. TaxID=1926495 RepID=UPI0039E3FB45